MDKRIIVILAVVLGLLAIGLAVFVYSNRVANTRRTTTTQNIREATPSGSRVPALSTGGTSPITSINQANMKTYFGVGFNMQYPKNWGILTCSNSKNFEFDPINSTDQLGVSCDRALKSVTVLVAENLNCQGESVKLGDLQVIKVKDESKGGRVTYRWCVFTSGSDLDITHRVSAEERRGYSKEDYSTQVEQMVSTLKLTGGS